MTHINNSGWNEVPMIATSRKLIEAPIKSCGKNCGTDAKANYYAALDVMNKSGLLSWQFELKLLILEFMMEFHIQINCNRRSHNKQCGWTIIRGSHKWTRKIDEV